MHWCIKITKTALDISCVRRVLIFHMCRQALPPKYQADCHRTYKRAKNWSKYFIAHIRSRPALPLSSCSERHPWYFPNLVNSSYGTTTLSLYMEHLPSPPPSPRIKSPLVQQRITWSLAGSRAMDLPGTCEVTDDGGRPSRLVHLYNDSVTRPFPLSRTLLRGGPCRLSVDQRLYKFPNP
jgi:hypothetical protein